MNIVRNEPDKVKEFIAKWEPVLTNWNGKAEDPTFADDCWALGFEMDLGKSIQKAFPRRHVTSARVLKNILPKIDDLLFLGTAMFSYWRYLTHWHEAPLPEDACLWFKMAFKRLAELANIPPMPHEPPRK